MNFKEKESELRNELIKAYTDMVKKFGAIWQDIYELHTFQYCSDYGCELDGSTIDKIEYDGTNLLFYFNENTKDYANSVIFSTSDLIDFYDDLRSAMEEEFKENYNK